VRWLWLCIGMSIWASDAIAQARIESEYKIAVPQEKETEVWSFLENAFAKNELGILPENSTTNIDTEVFYDTYFDDANKTLLSYKAGARFRERYVQDSLVKQLIQLKVPTLDELGVARKEYKFTPEIYRDITDRNGLHPFLKYVKSKDLSDMDLVLGQFGTSAKELTDAIKLKQTRKRIYVSDAKGPLMTFTLDEVSSFYFPYTSFVELELELNEVRYTDADYTEQKFMEEINANTKQALFDHFEYLVQDQTPKYNKMQEAIARQPIAWVYNNMMYLLLGIIVLSAGILLLKNEVRFANT